MPIDVRADHLDIIRAILVRYVPRHEILAFGSRVTGRAHKNSDLDLCIRGVEPLSFSELAHLRDAFSESNLPYKVDVVDWHATSEGFQSIITRDGVPL